LARLEAFQTEAGIPPAFYHARLTDFQSGIKADPRRGFRIFGKPRIGKTHFMCAVGTALILEGYKVRFITVPELIDELRLASQFDRMDCAPKPWTAQKFSTVPILLLDDLGTSRETAFSAESLFTVFNHRLNHRLHLSVTGNISLRELDVRLLGRLVDMTTEVIL